MAQVKTPTWRRVRNPSVRNTSSLGHKSHAHHHHGGGGQQHVMFTILSSLILVSFTTRWKTWSGSRTWTIFANTTNAWNRLVSRARAKGRQLIASWGGSCSTTPSAEKNCYRHATGTK